MSELVLLLLRIGFLVLMWFFVFGVVYSLRADLFGVRARKLPVEATAGAPAAAAAPASPARPSSSRPSLDFKFASSRDMYNTAALPALSAPRDESPSSPSLVLLPPNDA